MWSLERSALAPSSRTCWPFTVTRPSSIICSALRREVTPAPDKIFCRRCSPRPVRSGMRESYHLLVLTCYITGPRGIGRVSEAFAGGVSYVQLRAKDLEARELFKLALEAARAKGPGKLLINDRLDVALASGA